MANSINLSNANSALVASLMDAKESVHNPYEYSIEEQRPFSGVQYEELAAENAGSAGAGQSVTFNVSKVGFLRQAILKFTMTTPSATGTVKTTRLGGLAAIDRIELLSNSRRLCVLDRFGLQAAISDLPADIRKSFQRGLHMKSDGSAIGAGASYDMFLPLPFSTFYGARNAIATHFVEPIRVKVFFSTLSMGVEGQHGTSPGATAASVFTAAVSDPALLCRYDVLSNEEDDKVVESNYGDGPLSQLMWDYETEVGDSADISETATTKLSRTLTSNNVVTDLYAIVTCDIDSNTPTDVTAPADAVGYDAPLKLDRISFTGSGQNIVPDMKAEYLGFFGRISEGERLFATGSENVVGDDDPCTSCWVYKIQLCADSDKQKQTGGCSLRELNAPTVTVHVSKADGVDNINALKNKKATLRVVARHHSIISTDPASGKMTQLLTN